MDRFCRSAAFGVLPMYEVKTLSNGRVRRYENFFEAVRAFLKTGRRCSKSKKKKRGRATVILSVPEMK
jgi:hypothetical protein